MTSGGDFASEMRAAIREAKAAGLADAADALEGRAFAAYATSSEWLGETGLAIHEFLGRARGKVPPSVIEHLNVCLGEVAKVWPKLGRGRE
jgi:hypothetical protein